MTSHLAEHTAAAGRPCAVSEWRWQSGVLCPLLLLAEGSAWYVYCVQQLWASRFPGRFSDTCRRGCVRMWLVTLTRKHVIMCGIWGSRSGEHAVSGLLILVRIECGKTQEHVLWTNRPAGYSILGSTYSLLFSYVICLIGRLQFIVWALLATSVDVTPCAKTQNLYC